MFIDHYIHEVISTPKGMVLIDVANTPDCGWEGAYSLFNEKTFAEQWDGEAWDMNDIIEYGEELGAFEEWEIVSSYHKTPNAALKKLMAAVKAI